MTLSDIVSDLHRYDEEPYGGVTPAIFVAEPWTPTSTASVSWSSDKGGLPFRQKPIQFYLTSIREALALLGPEYDDYILRGESEALCRKLITHITALNSARARRDV